MNKDKNKGLLTRILPLFVFLFFMSACSDNHDNFSEQIPVKKIKVAVLMREEEQARWERTAQWALDNMDKAQQGLPQKIELQLEFYRQDRDDIEDCMRQIAEDTTIAAVVGPTTSPCATLMAQKLNARKAYHKPMITPSATHTEYQRQFANTSFVWNMAESDIAQLEVLIAGIAISHSTEPVSLLTANDGNDYEEWFGFIAEEYGLSVGKIYLYDTADDVRRYVHEICGTDWRKGSEALIFNSSDMEMALALDDEIGKMRSELEASGLRKYLYVPSIFCSDNFVSDQIARSMVHTAYQGVDLYAMPESGFGQAYQQRFGEDLVNGEAQFYDALCLVAYAGVLSNNTHQTLNDAILSVVDGRDGKGYSWLPYDMHDNFLLFSKGITPDIDGVSSTWTFDEQTHSGVVESSFRRWFLYDKEFVTTEYVSTDGSKRTSSSKNIWDWTSSHLQGFDVTDGNDLTYPNLDDRWALLIAASKGWENYRFQADVFAMRQILKKYGYADDHIVLICEDDLAYNSLNPEQGVLRVHETGENLYDASAIDYKLSDLTPEDIGDILQGNQSERLPHVLGADDDDNVFVFWSGHGMMGSMDFGGKQSVSYQQMRDILAQTPHRKLLFAIESCYSGGLGEYCTGLPGTLFVTAASPYETSHADVWSKNLGVYLSNGFTRGFQEAINQNQAISLRDLYYMLAKTTVGSHVKVYNTKNFGSLYENTMEEFL